MSLEHLVVPKSREGLKQNKKQNSTLVDGRQKFSQANGRVPGG